MWSQCRRQQPSMNFFSRVQSDKWDKIGIKMYLPWKPLKCRREEWPQNGVQTSFIAAVVGKWVWVILFTLCFFKASSALNWVCVIISQAQLDIMSSWWCSNFAVRIMGCPAEAEMVWSIKKDHLEVWRESELITTQDKNTSPAQASLQSPYSQACRLIHINVKEVIRYNQ